MKITFVGNFSVDYSSESHYLKTLKKLGHEVITIQENNPVINEVIEKAKTADIFFWVHTHGWSTPGIEDIMNDFKTNHKPIFGYHLDLWLGIEREKDLKSDNYWKWLDYFFCTDSIMVDYLNATPSMPRAFYIPAGVFEDECYIGDFKNEYAKDIIFVGSKGYHPEWQYRPKLISWLENTYGDRFAQWGGGGLGTIRGKELNNLYASAKIVIGDSLCKNFNYPYYISDRLFETIGRGGFIIFPYIKGIEDFFKIGEELITYKFNDFTGLASKIDYYLSHSAEREAIRNAGFERVKKEHTYTHRLSKILEILEVEKNHHE